MIRYNLKNIIKGETWKVQNSNDYKYQIDTNRGDIMSGANTLEKEHILMIPAIATKDHALVEFKAGLVRSMQQYNAGLVKTFDNVEDLLADLHSPE